MRGDRNVLGGSVSCDDEEDGISVKSGAALSAPISVSTTGGGCDVGGVACPTDGRRAAR